MPHPRRFLCVVPDAVVSSPAERSAAEAAFGCPGLPDSPRPFLGAAVLPSPLHLLLLPLQQHGRSDGRSSSLACTQVLYWVRLIRFLRRAASTVVMLARCLGGQVGEEGSHDTVTCAGSRHTTSPVLKEQIRQTASADRSQENGHIYEGVTPTR